MKKHTEYGKSILMESGEWQGGYNLLELAIEIAERHHEGWDGKGYPNGLKYDQIHLFGRIIMIVDIFDALTRKGLQAFTHT